MKKTEVNHYGFSEKRQGNPRLLPNLPQMSITELQNLLTTEIGNIISKEAKRIDQLLEKETRENCTPKIKGQITKGKLKWRGITLVQQRKGLIFETWIEQRGVIITSKISFNEKETRP